MDNNISIVWDFDGTLTPDDSTSKTIDVLTGEGGMVINNGQSVNNRINFFLLI